MLEALDANGTRTIVVETANRFARDLMVQEIGFAMLRARGINLIAATARPRFRRHAYVIYVPTGLVVMALRNASGEAMVEMVCVPSPTP